MNPNEQPLVEKYLQDLIKDKPSSNLKLLAVWDSLLIETQIKILSVIETIPYELKIKALESPNAYIRYLIADQLYFLENENNEYTELLEKVGKDSSPLIKFLNSTRIKPESFFHLSKEEKIMYINQHNIRRGKEIAEIIEWGLKNSTINQDDLYIIVKEYIKNISEAKHFSYYNYYSEKGYEAFWQLVPKLGLTNTTMLLVKYLPADSYFSSAAYIPIDVLNSLNQQLLIILLTRSDVFLKKFRKNMVLSSGTEYSEDVRKAAASYNLFIGDDDISELIKNKSIDVIKFIIRCTEDFPDLSYLPPIYAYALNDLQDKFIELSYEQVNINPSRFNNFFEELTKPWSTCTEYDKKQQIKWQLLKLAVYVLAKKAAPYKNFPNYIDVKINVLDGKLKFLKSKIIPNDTWATYLAFSKELLGKSRWEKELLKRIPKGFRIFLPLSSNVPSYLFGSDELQRIPNYLI